MYKQAEKKVNEWKEFVKKQNYTKEWKKAEIKQYSKDLDVALEMFRCLQDRNDIHVISLIKWLQLLINDQDLVEYQKSCDKAW